MDNNDADRLIVEHVLIRFAFHRYVNGLDPIGAFNAVRGELGHLVEQMIARASIVGPIPGVYIGDEFFTRAEMHLIGLHDDLVRGISLARFHGVDIASCIVAVYGRHDFFLNSNLFIYGGEGANLYLANNVFQIRVLGNQRWTRRNIAMFNSIEHGNPVRLIVKVLMEDDTFRYIYFGFFRVLDWRVILSNEGFEVIEFLLRRLLY